jgi:hypothetical protein
VLLKELGAPRSAVIQTFTEVRFKDSAGKAVIPDGAIVCERGRKSWTCLVEVKTGKTDLRDEQVGGYLDVARENGFDGVLTISNQITATSIESPVTVDKRKRGLWRSSWWRIITEAIVQNRYRGDKRPRSGLDPGRAHRLRRKRDVSIDDRDGLVEKHHSAGGRSSCFCASKR